ncbi:MAG TPA: flagellin [Candidatus Nitrosotalea sp.]|jgi:flagellin|nr:flagellin [Candidatus Nitrosotalea sp.]
MIINTNVSALNASRNLNTTGNALQQSIARLSSGFRINQASDDAAGLSIANTLQAQVGSLNAASRNASQAGSLVQIASGAVDTITSILDRMKELATEAASDTVTSTDRQKINAEYTTLRSEIGRIVSNTKYQGQTLLDGSYGVSVSGGTALTTAGSGLGAGTSGTVMLSGASPNATYTITDAAGAAIQMSDGTTTQIVTQSAASGAQTIVFDKLGVTLNVDGSYAAGGLNGLTVTTGAASGGRFTVGSGAVVGEDTIDLNLANLTTGAAGLNLDGTDLTSLTNAQTVITRLDAAISTVASADGNIGAAENRFTYASQNLASLIQNLTASESTIRDADMAAEMVNFTKEQILQQAGTAMLAQANSAPQSILTLLKG